MKPRSCVERFDCSPASPAWRAPAALLHDGSPLAWYISHRDPARKPLVQRPGPVVVDAERAGGSVHAHRGVDKPRQDGVHADPVRRVRARERVGDRVHRGLRALVSERRVAHRLRACHDRRDRGDVRDRAALLLLHDRQRGLGHQQRAAGVHPHDLLPGLEFDPLGPAVAGCDAHVVVDHVQAAELLDRGGDDPPAVRLHAHVSLSHDRLAGLFGDRRTRRLGRVAIAIHQHHPRALTREEDRGGAAVANLLAGRLPGAGHDRDLAVQPAARSVLRGHSVMIPKMEQVVIARRFNGPPDSAQGGYACGVVAERIAAPVATVSLRRPPPLERPLAVRRNANEAVSLLDGEELVAEGAPSTLELEVPPPVGFDEAGAASAANPWTGRHPFPTCFGCGPDRNPDDAIRLILGAVDGRDLMADAWMPHPSLGDKDGRVTKLFVWSALDCPTGSAAIDPTSGTAVLGSLTVDPERAPVLVGEPHVVIAWLIGRDGRKSRGGAAIYDEEGRVCAISEGLWIRLRDPSVVGARV